MSALKYLIIISIIITAGGFTADILGEYVGPLEYQGYLGFGYPEGDNPINNIVFTVDSTIAGNLIILDVPSMWSYSYSGGVLTLSGGSLSPGGEVLVKVSLNKYFEDGEYAVSSVGTTTWGETSQSSGPLLVGELNFLNMLGLASAYRFPLAASVVGLGFIELILSRRKRKDEDIDSTNEKTSLVENIGTYSEYDDSDLPGLDDLDVSGKIESDSSKSDDIEYDDSDLPGLKPDPSPTDSSVPDGGDETYEVPSERKYRIKYQVRSQDGSIYVREEDVTLKEYTAGLIGIPMGPTPVWDPGETYMDYRRYWYELFGEWFDRELLMIQKSPEKLKHLQNYIDDYANMLTVTRERAKIPREEREYDESLFSKEFKDALDKILMDKSTTLLFRKYLGDPE